MSQLELPADDSCINVIPHLVTNSPPLIVEADLYTTFRTISPVNNSNISIDVTAYIINNYKQLSN